MVKKWVRENIPDVSVIVPAYNEEGTIAKVINGLLAVKTIIPSLEIIVVDDGSTDATVKRVFEFLNSRFNFNNSGLYFYSFNNSILLWIFYF